MRRLPLVLALAAAIVPLPAAAVVPCQPVEAAQTRCPAWEARYSEAVNASDAARDILVSPDGMFAIVTGISYGATSRSAEIVTVAYETATGNQRWSTMYSSPGRDAGVALASNSKHVFVTGTSNGSSGESDIVTVAYDLATGAQAWVAPFAAPGLDSPSGIAATDDLVFVTGQSGDQPVTIAYDAATGTTAWTRLIQEFGSSAGVVTTPDGQHVYMAATVGEENPNMAVVSLAPETGVVRWDRRIDGRDELQDQAVDIDASAQRVVVAGTSTRSATDTDIVTSWYNHAGQFMRGSGFSAATDSTDRAVAITFGPDGLSAYLVGIVDRGDTSADDWITLQFPGAPGPGSFGWRSTYDGPTHRFDAPTDVAMSPDGSRVYVTGNSGHLGVGVGAGGGENNFGYAFDDYTTIAYDTSTGDQAWIGRYDGKNGYTDTAYGLAVGPDGRVYVTGSADMARTPPGAEPVLGHATGFDYITLAYEA